MLQAAVSNSSDQSSNIPLRKVTNDISDILGHINAEKKELISNQEYSEFPISAIPKKMEEIVFKTCKANGYDPDYLISSMLSAVSAAIGSTYNLKVKSGWLESASTYIITVGRPGIGKSAPGKAAYLPIQKKESLLYKEFQYRIIEFKQSKNAENAQNARNAENVSIEKPKRQQYIIQDTTLEALCFALSVNRRGLALVQDEIAGWFKNLNRYNKGSDIEFYLQTFSGGYYSVNRKNEDSLLLENPFLSLYGTIQPSVLNEIFKENKSNNGLIDRFLFCYPERKCLPIFKWEDLDDSYNNEYEEIINRLLCLDFNEGKPNTLTLSEEAKNVFSTWNKKHREIVDSTNNDQLSGMFAKLETYVLRFSLIHQLLAWACKEAEKFQVEESAMLSAIETVEYFKKMALKVNPIDTEISIPLDQLRLAIYKLLPTDFTTGEGIEIIENYNSNNPSMTYSVRSFGNWLKETEFFIKIKTGHYRKAL